MAAQQKRAPTKKKKTSRSYGTSLTGSEPVPVIVEMVVPAADGPAAAFNLGASAFDAVGLQVDQSWDPIPVGAPPESAMSLEAANEETVLVRGTVQSDQIAELENRDDVAGVWLDTTIAAFDYGEEPQRDFVDTVQSAAFGVCPIPPCDCPPPMTAKGDIPAVRAYLGVDAIWADGIKGQGIVVGVVDGGLTTPSRVGGGKIPNVIGGPKADWGTKAFWGGHGEMSATDVLGMASEAKLYDIRLPDGGPGDTLSAQISDAIAGYHWAIQRHKVDGTPHILTNSWGIYQKNWDPVYAEDANHPFTRKVVDALDEGILVLFAAGNCGQACPSSRCGGDNGPGKSIWGANGHERVMTVGAANTKEELIGYSSQGPAALSNQKPDFCSISHFKGYYPVDNGTSAACPVAAGVVALLKQAKPALTQAAVKACLKATAKNIGPAGWDQHSGSGIIQAEAAYRHCAKPQPPQRCERERKNAIRCRNLYRRTRQRKYLCCFYYWAALYFRCKYKQTGDRRYLCRFYYYAALFFRCRYRLRRQRSDYRLYRKYRALYRRCR